MLCGGVFGLPSHPKKPNNPERVDSDRASIIYIYIHTQIYLYIYIYISTCRFRVSPFLCQGVVGGVASLLPRRQSISGTRGRVSADLAPTLLRITGSQAIRKKGSSGSIRMNCTLFHKRDCSHFSFGCPLMRRFCSNQLVQSTLPSTTSQHPKSFNEKFSWKGCGEDISECPYGAC